MIKLISILTAKFLLVVFTITIYHRKKSVVKALTSDEIEAHLSYFVVCTFIAKMIQ